MATPFAQLFSRTGAPNLVRQFGETITYYPLGAGSGRTITAKVERRVEVLAEAGDQTAQSLIITVRDDATYGISATEINDGSDEVSVSLITGGTPERRQITHVFDDSNGLVRFQVR